MAKAELIIPAPKPTGVNLSLTMKEAADLCVSLEYFRNNKIRYDEGGQLFNIEKALEEVLKGEE